jgi:hypothetical protein
LPASGAVRNQTGGVRSERNLLSPNSLLFTFFQVLRRIKLRVIKKG